MVFDCDSIKTAGYKVQVTFPLQMGSVKDRSWGEESGISSLGYYLHLLPAFWVESRSVNPPLRRYSVGLTSLVFPELICEHPCPLHTTKPVVLVDF